MSVYVWSHPPISV